jgi:hypothetical protein
VLLAGLAAAGAAIVWRVAVVPELASGWISLCLAIPVLFAASLLQARNGTVFIGLAFNMLFAVLARPVDANSDMPMRLITIEAMLLAGIALSYVFYRWLLPIDTKRRRRNIREAIRREITAIAVRASTPLADRHLARLRHLVFSLAARSRGDIQESEDALAALSLGHVLLRLGEMQSDPTVSKTYLAAIGEVNDLARMPMVAPKSVGEFLHHKALSLGRLGIVDTLSNRTREAQISWLLEVAALNLCSHPSIFAVSAASRRR